MACFVDLSKAFDCVNAEILIGKLSALGIQNYARDWLASYLSNRYQSAPSPVSKLYALSGNTYA
ncbi:hypothetical protein J6590_041713 [Homalodisca vitripennis]|nr:hypothetical protein J6590_041713 [Homalodisca vitripennis]